MSHDPCPEVVVVVVVAAAHQTQRWVQDRISPQVEVAEGAAGAVVVGILTYRAGAVEVVEAVGVGVEAPLCLHQPRMQAGLEAFGHCPMEFDHV